MTMKDMLLLLILLTVVCFVPGSVEMEVVITYHNLTGLVAEEGSRYTVVSHNEMVESREGRLSIKHLNGTSLSEADLGYQPDELHARSLNDGTHIVAVSHAAERSSLDKVSYCNYYATRDPGLICRERQSFSPPTSFVVSTLVDENVNDFKVRVIYFHQFEYRVRDLRAEIDEPLELPANCTCSNFSNCLKQDDELKGRVILRCDSAASCLYDLNSQFCYYISIPNVKQLATTRYKDMIFVVQWAEGRFQDMLIETNMVMHLERAATHPLRGVFANSSNPATIQDVSIVSVNQTEVFFFIQRNEILLFEVVDLEIVPEIRHVPLSADLTPTAIRGIFDSSIAVEGIYSNGTLVLMIIEVHASQLTADDNTGSNNLPPSIKDPTSSIPQGRNVTDPPGSTEEPDPSNKPQPTNMADDPVNSVTRDCSNSSAVAIPVGTFFAGIILTLLCGVVAMLLCRLRMSRGHNIEMAERNSR